MTNMTSRSDTEWWDAFNRADENASRRRHPAGRARTPMDTAEDFHAEAAEIDAQTGRVLPRRIDPPIRIAEHPSPPTSLLECVVMGALGGLATMAIAWVLLATFYGWEGIV